MCLDHNEFDFYRYFLNHSNHIEGIPLDMIAYHYYSIGHNRTDPNDWESFFTQFDPFIEEVKQIEQIRKSLSPQTRTTIDELGVILPDDNSPTAEQFPLIYWNAASGFYAYAWGVLSQQGIDVIAHSQLVGYPQITKLNFSPNYPSVTMLNWTTGEGTAKYWTTKLLIETAQIDRDHAVETQTSDSTGQIIYTQAFLGENQRKWILIVNKRFVHVQVQLSGFVGAQMFTIDESTANSPPKQTILSSNIIDLNPFAVLIIRTS